MQKRFLLPVLFLHSAVVWAADTSARRAEEAHVHGQVLLDIAVEGAEVSVQLESAAINLLGFEHSPGTPAELALVERIGGLVLEHATLLSFGDAGCVQKDVVSDFLIFGASDQEHQVHEHDSAIPHRHADAEHGDIHLRYKIECRQTRTLEVAFRGFGEFPGITAVVVQWLHGTHQGRAVLTPDDPAFRME